MKKVIRLSENELIKVIKILIKENDSERISIPSQFKGVRKVSGVSVHPEDIIDDYNEWVIEGIPLDSYSNGVFFNEEDEEVKLEDILDDLDYAIINDVNYSFVEHMNTLDYIMKQFNKNTTEKELEFLLNQIEYELQSAFESEELTDDEINEVVEYGNELSDTMIEKFKMFEKYKMIGKSKKNQK